MPKPNDISAEEWAQIEFYAGMAGMTPEQYLQAMDAQPQRQASEYRYEAGITDGQYASMGKSYQDEIDQIWRDSGNYPPTSEQINAAVNRNSAPEGSSTARLRELYKAQEELERQYRASPSRGVAAGQQQIPGAGGAVGAATAAADREVADSIQREQDQNMGYFGQTVDPALAQQRSAVTNQQTANRLAETELRGAGNTLNQQLAATQTQRQAGINSANSTQNQAMESLLGANRASNQQATTAAQSLNNNLSNISRNQSAASDRLGSQLGAINAQQSAANAALGSQLTNSNNQAWAATDEFGNQMNAANYDQNLARARLDQNLYEQSQRGIHYVEDLEDSTWGLNAEDQASTQRYLEQTNPLLAEKFARGSDPRLVQQVQDVHDRFKQLSNPEVTAQERFIAELARRKTESQDKSSRDAVYEQMKQRGLNSGGQQIAAQLANRQATSQDRVLAELGLSASAQERAFSALGQQGDVAAQLRGADDGMRQFQDQYAQNDAQRRQSVMQGQVDTQQRSTAQRGERNNQLFGAQRANNNDDTNRSGMSFDAGNQSIAANAGRNAQVFDATSNTINSNSNRDVQRFDATSTTNRDNAGRNVNVFDANTATNEGNTNRAGMGFDATRGVINDNAGRDAVDYDARTGTNEANFDRSSYGWDTSDQNSGIGYDIARNNATTSISNRQNEVGSAQGLTGSSVAAANQRGGYVSTAEQARRARAQQQAADSILGSVQSPDDEDEN